MTPQELKNSILQLAIQGKLVEQRAEEGTAEELYAEIQKEKQKLIKEGKIKKEKPLPEIAEDEKPFDIPESWTWVRLSTVISLLSGSDLTPEKYNSQEKGIPYITGASNIENDQLVINRWTECPNNIARRGDLLLTCKGTVGKTTILQEETVHVARQIMALTPIQINTQYLRFFIDGQVEILKKKAKSMIPGIERDNVLKIAFPLPPLAEQKRIVAKIEELLPMVEEYGKAQEQLATLNTEFPDKLRKSILQQAVQGKLTERDPSDEPASELLKRIKAEKENLIKSGKIKKGKPLPAITDDEKPFDIPDTWEWTTIAEVCTNIQYGTSEKSHSKGTVAVLRMGNIQNGIIDYSNLVYSSNAEDIRKYHLDYNDLVFNRTNSKELVGKTAIYKAEIPAIYAGYLVRITPIIIDSDYLNFVMQSKIFKDYCAAVKTDAIGQSNINAEKMKQFAFPLPPLAEQKRIVKRVDELLALCEGLK